MTVAQKKDLTSSKLSTVKNILGYVISSEVPLESMDRRLGDAYTFWREKE